MLKILAGLYASAHPKAAKLATLSNVLAGPTSNALFLPPSGQYFDLCYEWLKLEDSLALEFAAKTLQKLAGLFKDDLLEYFSLKRIAQLLMEAGYAIGVNSVRIVLENKRLCSNDAAVSDSANLSSAITELLKSTDRSIQLNTFKLILQFPKAASNLEVLLESAITWIATAKLSELSGEEFQSSQPSLDALADMVQSLASSNISARFIVIQNLIRIMDSADYISPGLCLLLPPMDQTTQSQIAFHHVAEATLTKCFCVVVGWPQTEVVAQWASFLADAYSQHVKSSPNFAHLYTQWLCIVDAVLPFCSKQLYVNALRRGSLVTIERLILGSHRSPKLFHKILPDLVRCFKLLHFHRLGLQKQATATPNSSAILALSPLASPKATIQHALLCEQIGGHPEKFQIDETWLSTPLSSPSNLHFELDKIDSTLQKLADLLYVLMFHHKGYPELYGPVMQAIREFSQPSDVFMKDQLSKWSFTSSDNSFSSLEYNAVSDSFEAQGRSQALKQAGLCGLVNLGNTCFLNSFVQALFMTDTLAEALTHHPASAVEPILKQLQLLFASQLNTARSVYSPTGFHQALPPWCRGGQQQDAGEFGKFLFDTMDTAMKKEGYEGTISTLFGGKSATLTKCLHCNTISSREENFTDLTLSFPPSPSEPGQTRGNSPLTLGEMLKYFVTPEQLNGANQYRCDVCQGLQDAEKRTAVVSAPTHLICSLSRFSFDYKTQKRSKILTEVEYPEVLMVPVENLATGGTSQAQYVLYAVVMHSGQSAEYGHYYSYARHTRQFQNPGAVLTDEKLSWYRFNDEQVDASNFASFSSITKNFSSDVAYLLFYVRCDETPTEPMATDMSVDLVAHVEAENAAFSKELAARASRQASSKSTRSSVTSNVIRRFDDPDGSGGGSGMGFGGGRLVF